MRAAAAIEHTTAQVREAFEKDVADAIINDAELFEAAARLLGRDATPQQVTDTVREIAGTVDDGLADWLTEVAEAPGGWFYRQVTDRF